MTKRVSFLPFFTAALLAACLLNPRPACAADHGEAVVTAPDAFTVMDPAEEAHKIRRLAKLALANNASQASRDVLSEEIDTVEKNKKLKKDVVTHLLQDDSPDPTLPKIVLVKYPDGAVRGLLFIQTDGVRGDNANRLAWPLDPKREQKAQSR